MGILNLALAGMLAGGAAFAGEAPKKSAAELEKEKAMQNPYANDLGPDSVDTAAYPKGAQEGYKLMREKCARCHTPSRPLNSQFVETAGKTPEERKKSLEALKKSEPGLFKDKNVWQVEDGIWQRYVKRMMSKPGCDIPGPEGKKIWEFLSHDSRERKLGAAKAKWGEHRRKLLEDFKAKHPARFTELYSAK
mgnify:FL=1